MSHAVSTVSGVESDLHGVPLRWIEGHTILPKLALNLAFRGRPLSAEGQQTNDTAGTRVGHRDFGLLSRKMVQIQVIH